MLLKAMALNKRVREHRRANDKFAEGISRTRRDLIIGMPMLF